MSSKKPSLVELQHAIYASKNPTRRWLHNTRKNRVIASIDELGLPDDARVMEIGPGSGVYLPHLCGSLGTVDALDIELSHLTDIEPLQEDLSNLSLVHADIHVYAKTCEKYDMILCSEVLEHVPDPEAFMVSLSACLKEGGYLVLSTPQPNSLIELAGKIALSPYFIWIPRLVYREPILPTGHISLTSVRKLKKMMDDNQLERQKLEIFGLYVPIIAEVSGSLGPKILGALEKFLLKINMSWPIWTQLHVARK